MTGARQRVPEQDLCLYYTVLAIFPGRGARATGGRGPAGRRSLAAAGFCSVLPFRQDGQFVFFSVGFRASAVLLDIVIYSDITC